MQIDREKKKEINIEAIAPPRAAPFSVPVATERLLAWGIVLVAMAAGAFLRLWEVNAIGYNTDEAVYSGQAAAVAGVPGLKENFPVFRAHPLLFQFVLSLVYKIHFDDLVGRLLAVAVGLGTVYLTYELG